MRDNNILPQTSENYGKLGFPVLDVYLVNSKELSLRKGSIDETLLESIFVKECYHPNMWFNRNLRDGFILDSVKTIIDLGANIGLASCYFANLFNDATIYAFEPESDNYELLLRNTCSFSNIMTYHKAIWKDSEGVYISNRNEILGHSGKANPAKYMVGSVPKENEELVSSISLSEFMMKEHIDSIDILKIDIQGAEIELFEDSEFWIDKVRVIFIEVHDFFRKGCSSVVLEKIALHGKFVFVGSPNGEILAFLREDELCE